MQIVQLSPHFYLHEFDCPCRKFCGGSNPRPPELLLEVLEYYHDLVSERMGFKFKCKLTSAFRCLPHNRTVGSNDWSRHPKNEAADTRDLYHRVPTNILLECAEKAFELLRKRGKAANDERQFVYGGIGIYDTFVHIDIRKKKARWDERT